MKVYAVGGCLRDALLGLKPRDVDFCVVGSSPQELLEWNPELKQVGADFPVFIDNKGTEFALARTERKVHSGYNGFKVDYNKDITLEEDLGRRDLTINAMAREVDYDPITSRWTFVGDLIDPYNGQEDLKNRILRHTTDDFKEDPVRVLRVARFRARYGFRVDPKTIGFIENMAQMGELKALTPERVFMELDKAVQETYPELFFDVLSLYALNIIFPEFAQISVDRLRVAGLRGASRLTRWAALFHDELVDTTLDHIKAPKVVRTAIDDAKLLRQMFAEYHTALSATDVSAQDKADVLLDTLLLLKAHQSPDRLFQAIDVLPVLNDVDLMHFGDLLLASHTKITGLDTTHITEDDSLKGAKIGIAINLARVEAIAELLS